MRPRGRMDPALAPHRAPAATPFGRCCGGPASEPLACTDPLLPPGIDAS